jgi:hypothetical protein
MRSHRIALGFVVALLAAGAASADEVKKGGSGTFADAGNWEGLKEYWTIKDGEIVGKTYPDGLRFNTFLCSKDKYGDFELKFQVRMRGKGWNGNSGVQIRSKIINPKTFAVGGPQCDMGDGYWGSLYGEAFGGMMKAADSSAINKVLKKDDFNDYHVKCVGKHVTIKINGVTGVDEDFAKMPAEGIIAWQLHAGGPMEVTFRNIEFTNLSEKR